MNLADVLQHSETGIPAVEGMLVLKPGIVTSVPLQATSLALHSNTQSLPRENWQWMPEVEDLKRETAVEPRSVPFMVPFSCFNALCDQCKTPVMDTFDWARHQRARNPPNSAALHQTLRRGASQWFYLPGQQKFLRCETHLTNSHKIFVFVVFLCETWCGLATTWSEFDVTLMKHDLLRGGLKGGGGGRGGGNGCSPLWLSGCGIDQHSLRAIGRQF